LVRIDTHWQEESNSMSTAIRKTILTVAAVAFTAVAFAQSGAPADTIKARQQRLKDMGAAFKTIRDQLKGTPDAAAVKTAAGEIKKGSVDLHNWFPKGTGPEAGVKTGAKAAIWADAEGFAASAKKFEEEAAKFAQLVDAGDMAAVSGGMKSLGQSCGGCHDKYRTKDE
jgi:cytochrome c556